PSAGSGSDVGTTDPDRCARCSTGDVPLEAGVAGGDASSRQGRCVAFDSAPAASCVASFARRPTPGAIGTDGWTWFNPLPFRCDVNGVGPPARGEVGPVGQLGAILHCDRDACAPVPSGTVAGLEDVWGAAPDDAWAVGQAGTILHWDGKAWSKIASPTDAPL